MKGKEDAALSGFEGTPETEWVSSFFMAVLFVTPPDEPGSDCMIQNKILFANIFLNSSRHRL